MARGKKVFLDRGVASGTGILRAPLAAKTPEDFEYLWPEANQDDFQWVLWSKPAGIYLYLDYTFFAFGECFCT